MTAAPSAPVRDAGGAPASTPGASAAVAQSRTDDSPRDRPSSGDARGPAPAPRVDCSGEGSRFEVGAGVGRAARARAYERVAADPVYRPLRIFTLDPAVSRASGSVALVNVPYEPLEPGPAGALFAVDNLDGRRGVRYRQVDLDDPAVLIRNGRDPSPSDPQFHQQMVYVVCTLVYAAFKRALGRDVAWGFDAPAADTGARLVCRPHAGDGRNAYYADGRGELCFGYYRAAERVAGANLPGGLVFTCLSHDVVAHEVTHALLDGLRSHFARPSGPDVLAFHEAFADLVAIFQHFSYREVVESAIRESQGRIEEAELLTGIARQFGHTTGSTRALRTAVALDDATGAPAQYADAGVDPYALGSVLVSAVFEAFLTIYRRKTARYVRLATGGSGVLPPGELPADLQRILAETASQLAGQFLTMCVRAIDYCPPVDLEFGEYLRAVVTADYDLVPDDPWGYREAWIDAFWRRGIYPRGVGSLSEDALLWRPPAARIPDVAELSFSRLAFDGDPGRPADARELRRQACALGELVTRPEYQHAFKLILPGDPLLDGDPVDLPSVESVRSSRRAGPDGQIAFDLVAEVTQRRVVRGRGGGAFELFGGATVILGPRGNLRYVVAKSVTDGRRMARQRAFVFGPEGRRFWTEAGGAHVPRPELFRLLHAAPGAD